MSSKQQNMMKDVADYWQRYGFSNDPFSPEQSPLDAYLSPQWQQQLDLIMHLSTESNAVLLVTGLAGIGKTTVLLRFVEQVADSAGICKIQGDSSISPSVLRYLLAKHLDLVTSDERNDNFMKQLLMQCEKMHQEKQRYILVIDNAHELPERTLQAILVIVSRQPQENPPLHVVLFGGTQLDARIAGITSQHIGEGATHTLRLSPLNYDYTKDYLAHRIQAVAQQDMDFPFTDVQVREIYKHSSGIPAIINVLARQTLAEKVISKLEPEDKPKRKLSISKRTLGFGISSVCCIAIAGLIVHAALNPHDEFSDVLEVKQFTGGEVILDEELQHTNLDDQLVERIRDLQDSYIEQAQLADTTLVEHNVEPIDTSKQLAPQSEAPITTQTSNVKADKVTAELKLLKPNKFAERMANKPGKVELDSTVTAATATTIASSPEPQQQMTLDIASSSEPQQQMTLDIVQPAPGSKSTPQVQVREGHVAVNNTQAEPKNISTQTTVSNVKVVEAKPVVDNKPKAAVPRATPRMRPILTHEEELLLSRTNKRYTMQLMGAYDKKPLEQFVKRNGLQDKVSYFHTYHNGRDWYAVVYGEYPSIEKARLALKTLPKPVQNSKPWIRTMASVKQSIRQLPPEQ